jgi:2-polyprenyl-6-hydroxyphenyl methylase/3-demethylubiquinone-9 3-methyltransferase
LKDRFEFGKNWQKFLKTLNKQKITNAKNSLKNIFLVENFRGKTFLDVGSGSGLFSLSALELGAKEVYSFDYDEYSVYATQQLKEKFYPNSSWQISRGDVLCDEFISNLRQYDYVYAWGVLHHTGNMYKAFENVSKLVKKDGYLVVAIYNTQLQTPIWKVIKKTYIKSPSFIRIIMNVFFTFYFWSGLFLYDIVRFRSPVSRYKNSTRGMSLYTDVVDWIGGYPFETAKPEEVFEFFKEKGFRLEKIITVGGKMGCNEFLLKKEKDV